MRRKSRLGESCDDVAEFAKNFGEGKSRLGDSCDDVAEFAKNFGEEEVTTRRFVRRWVGLRGKFENSRWLMPTTGLTAIATVDFLDATYLRHLLCTSKSETPCMSLAHRAVDLVETCY